MIKKILGVLVLIVGAALIYASTLPDSFKIERKITIKAPPEKIFPYINDLSNFPKWSPWEKLDVGMKRTLSPITVGKDAFYDWDGNDKVGAGNMQIIESTPSNRVVMKLSFRKPFEAVNTAEYRLQAQADGTEVSHSMYGPSPFISKVMSLAFSMDKMVGGAFEEGLQNLKNLSEKP